MLDFLMIVMICLVVAFVFSPSCACCNTVGNGTACTAACITNTTPSSLDFAVSGIGAGNTFPCTGGGDNCSALNATHTLSQNGSDPCKYEKLQFPSPDCDFDMTAVLIDFDASNFRVDLTINMDVGLGGDAVVYRLTISKPPDPMPCMDSITGSLTYVSSSGSGLYCNSDTSATITVTPNA